MRDTIEANWEPVAQKVVDLLGAVDDAPPDPGQLGAANGRIHDAAKAATELAYPIYVRLKVSSALDAFAGAACLVCDYTDASNQAFLVRAIVRDWARARQLFEDGSEVPTPRQLQFVADFDLDYGVRRLRFVLAGVSWLYRDLGRPGRPTRQQLDAVKERLSQAASLLEWMRSGNAFADDLLGGVSACFGEQRLREYLDAHHFDTEAFVRDHGGELDELYETLRTSRGSSSRPSRPICTATCSRPRPRGARARRRRRSVATCSCATSASRIWDAPPLPAPVDTQTQASGTRSRSSA